MVTKIVETCKSYNDDGSRKYVNLYDIRCLSTDTKPTTNVPNGSNLVEMDTGKVYFFDADSSQWLEF